eukprot:2092980-Amphidinium_carterae.1
MSHSRSAQHPMRENRLYLCWFTSRVWRPPQAPRQPAQDTHGTVQRRCRHLQPHKFCANLAGVESQDSLLQHQGGRRGGEQLGLKFCQRAE